MRADGQIISILYLSPYLISLSLVIGVSIYAFSSGRGRAIRAYGWMCVLEAALIGLFLLETLVPDLASRGFLESAESVILLAAPTAFLAIVHAFRSDLPYASSWWFRASIVLPAIFTLLLPFEFFRGLVMIDPRLAPHPLGSELAYGFGPLYFVSDAYVYGSFAAGMIRLALDLRQHEGRRFARGLLAILCTLVPVGLSTLTYLAPGVFPYRDMSPIAFGLGTLIILIPLGRIRFFDNIPYAESLAFMELPEAVLIFDERRNLLEANKAARYLFGLGRMPYGTARSASLLDGLDGLREELGGDGGVCEIGLRVGDAEREFSVQTAPVLFRGKPAGSIASFTDVTNLNNAGLALRRMRDGLESMVRERTADLQSEVQRRREAEGLLLVLNEELRNTQKEIMLTLSEVVENRSKETANHVLRVAQFSYEIAMAFGAGEERASMIRDAAPLHDIGKVAIPDRILNKPTGLSDDEWDVMRTHTEIGYDILRSSQRDLLKIAAVIAREHHERWDGKGYPRGLAGNDISLEGRIVSLADVVDALFSRRIYKEPWNLEDIELYVAEEKGGHFQPEIVEAFASRKDAIRDITERYPDAVGRAVRL